MDSEEIVGLLREIRDLKKRQIENQEDALKGQKQAIETQQQVARRQRMLSYFLMVFLLAMCAWVLFPQLLHR